MRAKLSILAIAGIAAMLSQQANADHRHVRTSIGVSVGSPWQPVPRFGAWGWGPSVGAWGFGPSVGIGVHVGPRTETRRVRTEERTERGALKLFVYPAAGQSDEQLAEDRFQCHVWAADESDFDPTLGAGSRPDAENYTRAFSACMEARNYVVR